MKLLIEQIEKYENIIIHRHKRPDYDAIGSQMALLEILKYNFPNKNIYAVGENGYEEFNQLGEVSKISNSLFKKSLAIVVDTANAIRIEDDRYKTAKFVIKIDHHQIKEEDQYGDLNYVEPTCSSTCELLFKICQQLDFKINNKIANYLYYGMYSDTGGFKFPSTTATTLLYASKLREYDWDFNETMNKLNSKPLKFQQLLGYAYENITVDRNTGYLIFNEQLIKERQLDNNDISQLVNYLGSIEELEKWVIFNQYDNFIRVNLRSRAQYDISKIANEFNGGGHKNASGATIHTEEEIKQVIDKLIALDREQ